MTNVNTTPTDSELTRSVDRWALDVSGVQSLYPTGSWRIRNAARELAGHEPNDPLSTVERGSDGVTVHIRAGVNAPAAETARVLHDVLLDQLLRTGEPVAQIEITIVDCTGTVR